MIALPKSLSISRSPSAATVEHAVAQESPSDEAIVIDESDHDDVRQVPQDLSAPAASSKRDASHDGRSTSGDNLKSDESDDDDDFESSSRRLAKKKKGK